MSIRNIPDEVYNALKARALSNERSTEAEVRFILKETLLPENRPNLAEVFAEFRRRTGGINLGDIRSKEIAEPMVFEEKRTVEE